ncbi:unnamed protein product [Toxocara canis]|uniref:Riboflavin transporter n=1 Tax=Toxocara canis TaxID=6265 RepID=A0A183V3C5_TOXCA|nr:unnamed protein product [Toxocara canis]
MLMKDCIQHIAVAAFGMGSWLSVNAVFVQLPLMVYVVPEGYDLATYIVLIVQIACIFPLVYGIIDAKMATVQLWNKYSHAILIPIMLIMSGAGLLMAAFVYDHPAVTSSSKHSYWLFVAFFIMSIPCTTSDVLFMPYITKLESTKYVATFFIGMGLSALIPSAVSLIQGANANLNGSAANPWGSTEGGVLFGPRAFLVLMAVLCCFSLIGFLVLLKQTSGTTEKNVSRVVFRAPSVSICSVDNGTVEKSGIRAYSVAESKASVGSETISSFSWYILLSISLLLGAVQNSVVPVILPYATQPYGQNVKIGPYNYLYVIFALSAGFISWERAAIAHVLRETSSGRGLFWCGAFTQIGSFIGALLMFLLSNVAHIFR